MSHSCRQSHCSLTVRGQRGDSHGEEKEGQEENQAVLKLQARASYWRGTFRFRGVIDLAKRLNEVRPLSLWRNDLLPSKSVAAAYRIGRVTKDAVRGHAR